MLTVLDPLMPLRQVNKLVVDCHNFPVKELVNLINVMPNLHILKWNYQSIDSTKSKLIQESETFKSVLCTNKIQHLEILHCCSLEEIRFFINLFPKLEYLKTGIYRREFVPITRYLFSTMHHLFFLCFTDVPKTYLKNLTAFIKLEHLLDEYFIKFVDHDQGCHLFRFLRKTSAFSLFFRYFSAVPLFFRFFTKKKLSFFIEKFCILKTR